MQRRNLFKMSAIATAAIAVSGSTALLTGCDASWITTAINDLPTIQGITESILAIVVLGDPALTPAISVAINAAIKLADVALVTTQALIADYKTSPSASVLAKIDGALTDLQQNLSQVLQVAQIKNAALQATIATGISLALSVISAIQLLIPASVTKIRGASLNVTVDRAQAKLAVPQKIKVTDSDTIKMLYNVVASSCGYSAQVVR